MNGSKLKEIITRMESREKLTANDIGWILQQEDFIGELSKLANDLRANSIGNQVCVHGIIEFSNYCRRNCKYCGLRAQNKEVKRYRLKPDQIIDLAIMAVKKFHYKMLVMQSGEDLDYSLDELVYIVKNIYEKSKGLIFLSIGERDQTTYEKLYLAGARGVLFRFETSNPNIYKELHPGATLNTRLEHLRFMRDVGYIISTGPLIGVPGQTDDDLVNDLLLVEELGAKMVSFGPFIAHTHTPLDNQKSITAEKMLKIIIAARLLMPRGRIPITTAMEYLWGDDFRKEALLAGANSFMLNLTPAGVRDLYDVYPNKNKLAAHLHSQMSIGKVQELVESCGMRICQGFGEEFELTPGEFVGGCNMTVRAD